MPVTLEVRRRNAAGDAAWSTGSASAATGAPTAPAAPTLSLTSSATRVGWTAPDDGGRAITGNEWQEPADGTAFSAPAAVGAGTTWVGLATLQPSSAGVRVRALNVKGPGAWSDVLAVAP